MDPGISKALADWVNSFTEDKLIGALTELSDGKKICKIINYMQTDNADDDASEIESWNTIKEFLNASNFHESVKHIGFDLAEGGSEIEIAKIVMILLSLTISCPNKEKLIQEMIKLDNETQLSIRCILMETLNEKKSSTADQHLFDVLTKEAVALVEQADPECSLSPTKNEDLNCAPPVSSKYDITESPVSIFSRSISTADKSVVCTPVNRIFRSLEEEEVYLSAPASCPPLRRACNARTSGIGLPHFVPGDCSPMQEFFASPVVNYKIKIRDMEQKNSILAKNLEAERVAKEDCEKRLSEAEATLTKFEQRLRGMSRLSIEKQQLFDEIDELHTIRQEKSDLEKENSKLKHRLEKCDAYSSERRQLEVQSKENEELVQQVKSLKSSLARITEKNKNIGALEESLKTQQEKNTIQEQEIAHLMTQVHKLKAQIAEQKEHYELRINDYKSIIEDKDSSTHENQGESMSIFMEHRVIELQGIIKDMEENWTKPDVAAKVKADLASCEKTMGVYQGKLQLITAEKLSLEEDIRRLHQETAAKSDEVIGFVKKLASANQKLKSSEANLETLHVQIETLTTDKDSLRSRIKELEDDVAASNNKISKLQVDLNLSTNQNESNNATIENQMRRLSELNQKIADLERQCRNLNNELLEAKNDSETAKKSHQHQVESLEKAIANEKRSVSTLEGKVASLDQENDSATSEIQGLKKTLISEKQTILNLNQDLDALKIQLKNSKATCFAHEDKINGLIEKMKLADASFEDKLRIKDGDILLLQEENLTKEQKIAELEEIGKAKSMEIRNKEEEFELVKEALESSKAALEEKNSKLADDLSELKESVLEKDENLRKLLESLDSSKSSLKDMKDQLQNSDEDFRSELTQKEVKIQSLETELQDFKTQQIDLKNEIDTLREIVDTKTSEQEKLKISLKSAVDSREKDAALMSEERDEFIRVEQNLKEELVKTTEDFEAKLSSLELLINQKNSDCGSLERKIIHLENELEKKEMDLQARLETGVQLDKTIFNLKEELQSSGDHHKKESSSLQDLLKEKDTSCALQESRIQQLLTENSKLVESMNARNDEIMKNQNSLEELMSTCTETQSSNKKMKEEIQELQDDVAAKIAEIQSVNLQLDGKKGEIIVLEEKIESTTSGLEASTQENCRIMKELEELSELLTSVKAQLSASQQKVDELTQNAEDMEEMKSKRISLETEISMLKEKLKEETEQGSILKMTLEEVKIQDINRLNEIAGLKSEIELKEEKIKAHESKLTLLEQQLLLDTAARDETVLDLMRVKSEIEVSEENHKEDLKLLNLKIQTLEERLAKQDAKYRTLEENSTKMEGESQVLKTSNVEMKEENRSLRTQIEEAENLLTSAKGEADNLQKKCKSLEKDTESSSREIVELKSQLSSMQGVVAERNEEILTIRKDLEEKIKSEEGNLSEKEAEIKSLKNSSEEEIESLKLLVDSKIKEAESFKREMVNLQTFSYEIEDTKEKYRTHIEMLEAKLKSTESDSASRLEEVTGVFDSKKERFEKEILRLEAELEQANQGCEQNKLESETNIKQIHADYDKQTKELQEKTDALDKLLENERDRCNALEERLSIEILDAEKRLSDAKNALDDMTKEKELQDNLNADLLQKNERLEEESKLIDAETKRLRLEKQDLQLEVESLVEEKNQSDEKLKMVRAQFTDKYREKQERTHMLEQQLKDWQARAEEETLKYDKASLMYNEKRNQLDEAIATLNQTREENLHLQETVRTMKIRNETLASNSSQQNVKKIEEQKKMRSLTIEVQRLNAQLEHAERQIRILRTEDRHSSRNSTCFFQPLTSVEEVATPTRRRSLDVINSYNPSKENLLRCHSDTFLDSPNNAKSKEEILRTPVCLKTRPCTSSNSDSTEPSMSQDHSASTSHISVETSLLADNSTQEVSQYSSHSQLAMSHGGQEPADVSMNSSTLTATSITSKASGRLSMLPRLPSSLAFQTAEEPEDYEFGSLSRLAELQGRNAATLPHLKSSYPIETQGQTPSKCDESVRIGDASTTMRRMTVLPSSLQRSLISSMDEASSTTSRRNTIDPYGQSRQGDINSHASDRQHSKRKIITKNEAQNRPQKNRRPGSNLSQQSSFDHDDQYQWHEDIPMQEIKEQIDPRRESVMFEIPNSPRKPVLRSRTARKAALERSQSSNTPVTAKRSSTLLKTPDKSKNAKRNVDEKRRTPSLMERVRKPLGRFNKK